MRYETKKENFTVTDDGYFLFGKQRKKVKCDCPAVREAKDELERFKVAIQETAPNEMDSVASVRASHFVKVLKRIIYAK